jgi:hypothetical protein
MGEFHGEGHGVGGLAQEIHPNALTQRGDLIGQNADGIAAQQGFD